MFFFNNKFNKNVYHDEMINMLNSAFKRLKSENSSFRIYTASIWTDPNAAASSVGFDNKENSLKSVAQSNEWNKKYYDQYIAEGNVEQAELFKPNENTRICNPANFALTNFAEIFNQSFPKNWEDKTNGRCWNKLQPALIQIGEYAFKEIKHLNIENGFELSINSNKDWYDQTWK